MWDKLKDKSLNPEWDRKDKAVPITVRSLEILICLTTAHAKLILSKKIKKVDEYAASQLSMYFLYLMKLKMKKKIIKEEKQKKMNHL